MSADVADPLEKLSSSTVSLATIVSPSALAFTFIACQISLALATCAAGMRTTLPDNLDVYHGEGTVDPNPF